MTSKRKGRPPSFELIQALQLVAAGHPVKLAGRVTGADNGNLWRVLKAHGADRESTPSLRARLVLAHYGQPLPPLPRNERASDPDQADPPEEPGIVPGCVR